MHSTQGRKLTVGRPRNVYVYSNPNRVSSTLFMWHTIPSVCPDSVVVEVEVDDFRVVNGWEFVQFLLDHNGGMVEF